MTNIKASVKGNILTIIVDLDKNSGPSKSGKSIIIASTGGNILVDGTEDVKMGLNIYRSSNSGE